MSIYWSIPCYDGIWAQEFKPDLTRSVLEACRNNDRVVDHTHVNAILIQPHWQRHDDLLMGDQPA